MVDVTEVTGTAPPFHAMSPADVAAHLEADLPRGLSAEEAAERLRRDGPNELPAPAGTSFLRRLARQIVEPMALLLLAAAAISAVALREAVEAVAILAIVILNAAIGLVEEGKAEAALEALRAMETPMARVRRDGRVHVVASRELVPGDLVVLQAGDQIPADLRVAKATALEVDEAILTGESLPAGKSVAAITDPEAGIGDRTSMLHAGTLVTRGAGEALVTATGPATELGKIAAGLAREEPTTPLQRELANLTGWLGGMAVLIALGVFALSVLRTDGALERAFLAAVALAVAAVPEGLATVVTVALALGVRRMAARGAIVRRLPAVETLGSTTVILSDKTGTLTENRMELTSVTLAQGTPQTLEAAPAQVRAAIESVVVLCNDAEDDPPSGDPVDLALLQAVGPERVRALRMGHPRLAGLPFEAERRRMTVVHTGDTAPWVLVKGAPETVLAMCDRAIGPGGSTALDPRALRAVEAAAAAMATTGMRMLGLARGDAPAEPPSELDGLERSLEFVALVALRDPARPEASLTVNEARRAGIDVVMVTGDHPGTAATIAREVGLRVDTVLTGADLRRDGVPDDPLVSHVYARVEPGQKLALAEALQSRHHVVAVTGDGVNDAPALRQADIGVAMGLTGSDVARQASDMVVTDDNLATIVAAIREGRAIFDNIRKVVDYLVAGNLAEIAVVITALLFVPELGVPLLPLQLLWINLVTDGLPAIALGVDGADADVMDRPPRPRGARLLSGRRLAVLSGRGGLIAAGALAGLVIEHRVLGGSWSDARTIAFCALMTAQILYVYVARFPTRGVWSNRWLVAAVVTGFVLQALVVVWPPAQELFGTRPLDVAEWALVLACGALPVVAMRLIPGLTAPR